MGKIIEYAQQQLDKSKHLLSLNGITRKPLRMATASSMILTAAKKLETWTGGIDPIYASIREFSKKASNNDDSYRMNSTTQDLYPTNDDAGLIEGVASVAPYRTISAIDITIDTLIYSFIPWVCSERVMTTQEQVISSKMMVAKNNAGGVLAGEELISNFSPESTNVDLSSPMKTLEYVAGSDSTMILSFGCQLFPGTLMITVATDAQGTGAIVGSDPTATGIVVFPGTDLSFKVDYATGTLTSTKNVSSSQFVSAVALLDAMSDPNAENVVHTTTGLKKSILIAKPMNIIVEDAMDRLMTILETIESSGGALTVEQYMNQTILDVFLASINNRIMRFLHARQMNQKLNDDIETTDLSSYSAQILADPARLEKELDTLVESLDAKMLSRANTGGTCLIVGSKISKLMATDPTRFKKSDTYKTNNNTFIGTYKDIPVLRHKYIDSNIDNKDPDGYGHIFLVFSDPNGEVAFLSYGVWIPPTTTDNVYNYNNPVQFAKALIAQIGMSVLEDELCQVGRFKQ